MTQGRQDPSAGWPGWSVGYNIDHQRADRDINNVGRDQYNHYIAHQQYILERRDSFMRDVAATKTKARWLIWIGLALFVIGFGMFAAAVLGFLSQGSRAIESQTFGPPEDPFGADILGVPSGLLGWAIAAVGALLIVIGLILHVSATARAKRVDRQFPLGPPVPPIP